MFQPILSLMVKTDENSQVVSTTIQRVQTELPIIIETQQNI